MHARLISESDDEFYLSGSLFGAMSPDPKAALAVPIEVWEKLDKHERSQLMHYAASRVDPMRRDPFTYSQIPPAAPVASIVRQNVGRMSPRSWVIHGGRLNGRDISTDKAVASGADDGPTIAAEALQHTEEPAMLEVNMLAKHEALQRAELALSQVQRRYDAHAGMVAAMLDLPATNENLARLRQVVAEGTGIERDLQTLKLDVGRVRNAFEVNFGNERLIPDMRNAAEKGDRQAHRRGFAQFLRGASLRAGDLGAAAQTDVGVLVMPGVTGLEGDVWRALCDPAGASDLDGILGALK